MTTHDMPSASLEMWGGVECTMNRVGEQYFDQLKYSKHATRITDLDLFAGLGLRAIRYPILWEHFAPEGFDSIDWTWADERIGRLLELGIRPIVGLTHHGSGPRHTSLTDSSFADGLAQFARLVAERFPQVSSFTPVNEPLTTARFSGLYGHWYPHGRDTYSFIRAVLTQCRAIVLAMKAIREVNPAAQLVQTEDLGRTYSTPLLSYQADFDNERRWLSYDLLCGCLTPGRVMWNFLLGHGATETELNWFLENPCPPDIIGINHYLTSDRYLDEDLSKYPANHHGGNGRHEYVDVEAVRACPHSRVDTGSLLRETWTRYGLPLAVTEAHLACTREEQLRWLKEVWDSSLGLREEGIDVRAVTSWSLLGAYDWNSLVTRCEGNYEPGVFDMRSDRPRPTALAGLIRSLSAGKPFEHPVLDQPGWWKRPERLLPAAVWSHNHYMSSSLIQARAVRESARPLLIVGATGTLGSAFVRICEPRGISCRVVSRQDMDICVPDTIDRVLEEIKPWAVINAAGFVRVDDAEHQAEECMRVNARGPAALAAACARHGIKLLTFSSDLVFDGKQSQPYCEKDLAAPLNVYGKSKALAESRVMEILPEALVVRTSAFFGPWDDYNFVSIALRTLDADEPFVAASDVTISPTYVCDLAHASLDLLIDGEKGVWHLANRGAITWAALARQAAEMAGIKSGAIVEQPLDSFGYPARRPVYSVLGSERGLILPTLDTALEHYLRDCDWIGSRRGATGRVGTERLKACA